MNQRIVLHVDFDYFYAQCEEIRTPALKTKPVAVCMFSDRGGDRGRFNRGSRDARPREMHKATCGDCGNECEIPFKPKEDRPVYCKECFPNHRRN